MSKQKMPQMYRDAHKACFKNWRILKKSKTCGCFYCLRVYAASEVGDWCVERDRRRTALCPYCAVDSVIPDASGWPLDADFLKKMKCWWFETGGVTIKVPDVIRKKLDAIGKKLNYINRVLPGGLFVADFFCGDGQVEKGFAGLRI